MKVTTCNVCNNSKNNLHYSANENMFGINENFEYFECAECGCLQIEEQPKDMSKYYPDNYYSFKSGSAFPKNNFKSRLMKKRDASVIFKKGIMGKLLSMIWPASSLLRIISGLQINRNTKILDVGSGAGLKLQPLANIGVNIKGIDPFISNDLKYDSGLIIEKRSIDDITETFDVVMFNHVFEHLADPLSVLKTTNKILNANGKCMLRIPTTSSYAWKHYGINWVQLDAPRHFFLHSINSIKILAEASGFILKEIIYDSTSFQFIGSELYLKGISHVNGDFSESNNKYFSNKELENFRKRSGELNANSAGDQAAFILVKK